MAGETLFDFFKSLPSADDLRRWEEEHARMGNAIKELTAKRDQLAELIKVGALIHGGNEALKRGYGNGNTGKIRARHDGRGTWMSAILEIAERNPDGVSYDAVRDQMPEPFASRLAKNPNAKSFYGAMGKLEVAERVMRHKGHLFTPSGFQEHMRKVRAGEIDDVEGHDPRGSPMTDALKAYLAEHPRTTAKAIKSHLCEIPEFAKGLKRNTSSIYNVLKKLRDREEIIHHEDGSYSLVDEIEAPFGIADGASEEEEAPTSSIETSPLFRVVK